jgi:hypothetical protein
MGIFQFGEGKALLILLLSFSFVEKQGMSQELTISSDDNSASGWTYNRGTKTLTVISNHHHVI